MQNRTAVGVATVGASYVKRWLEQHYDTLMSSAAARPLMEAGAPTRYGMEAALYVLTAYVDQQWTPTSVMGRMVREVARDASVEVSRRMINGFREVVLAQTRAERDEGEPPAPTVARRVEEALLQMDDEALGPLLVWLARIMPEERAKLRAMLAGCGEGDVDRVVSLPTEELAAMLSRFEPGPPLPDAPPPPKSSRFGVMMREKLDRANRRADEQLAARRRGREL